MCILKVFSTTSSFERFAAATQIPVFSVYEKGEIRSGRKKEKYTSYRISFDVSDAEWSSFPDQVTDAVGFLKMHFAELEQFIKDFEVDDAYLDFPIYSRLNADVINQNDHLPRELIGLAGKLSLGIEMSIYSEAALDDLAINRE